MFLQEVLILTKTGQLLVKYPSNLNDDVDLTAGFISALQTFSQTYYQAQLSDYSIGDTQFDILRLPEQDFFVVSRAKKHLSPELVKRKIALTRKIAIRFQKEFQIDFQNFSGEISQFKIFSNTIQEIIQLESPLFCDFILDLNQFDELGLESVRDLIQEYAPKLIRKLQPILICPYAIYTAYPINTDEILFRVILWDLDGTNRKILENEKRIDYWFRGEICTFSERIENHSIWHKSGLEIYDHYRHLRKHKSNLAIWTQNIGIRGHSCIICKTLLVDKEVGQCVICSSHLCTEHTINCGWCNAEMCNDDICSLSCSSCGMVLCDSCQNSCEICGKSRLCGDCVIWVEPMRAYLCLECWIDNFKDELDNLEHYSLKTLIEATNDGLNAGSLFKSVKLAYLKGDYEYVKKIYKFLKNYVENTHLSPIIRFNELMVKFKEKNTQLILLELQQAISEFKLFSTFSKDDRLIIFNEFNIFIEKLEEHFNSNPPTKLLLQKIKNQLNKILLSENNSYNIKNSKTQENKKDIPIDIKNIEELDATNKIEKQQHTINYFPFSPLKEYRFIRQDDRRYKIHKILFSKMDSIKRVHEDTLISLRISPLAHYWLFHGDFPLESDRLLGEYPIVPPHDLIKIVPYRQNYKISDEIFRL